MSKRSKYLEIETLKLQVDYLHKIIKELEIRHRCEIDYLINKYEKRLEQLSIVDDKGWYK